MRIEEGKYYAARDGRIVGPMRSHNVNPKVYPWRAGEDPATSMTYTAEGNWNCDGTESRHDLVAEIMPHASKPQHIAGPALLNWSETASPEYAPLAAILQEAYDQAATGKGKERHANDRAFIDQPILEIGRMCGPGFNTGQSIKKQQETMGMLARGERGAAIRELLGAINYTAAAILLIREQNPGA